MFNRRPRSWTDIPSASLAFLILRWKSLATSNLGLLSFFLVLLWLMVDLTGAPVVLLGRLTPRFSLHAAQAATLAPETNIVNTEVLPFPHNSHTPMSQGTGHP